MDPLVNPLALPGVRQRRIGVRGAEEDCGRTLGARGGRDEMQVQGVWARVPGTSGGEAGGVKSDQ
jgi:hypothetical protein